MIFDYERPPPSAHFAGGLSLTRRVTNLPLLANGASFLKYLGGMVNAAVKFCSRHGDAEGWTCYADEERLKLKCNAKNTSLFLRIDLQLTCDVGANAETSPIDKRLNALVRHKASLFQSPAARSAIAIIPVKQFDNGFVVGEELFCEYYQAPKPNHLCPLDMYRLPNVLQPMPVQRDLIVNLVSLIKPPWKALDRGRK
ncbi:hypothetical protein KC349_g45 [Hortaea werneckii]|nr:hypothetical protein KC349_g45 [Hortaea werneckii]